MPVQRDPSGWLQYYTLPFIKTLQERITDVVQAIAADIKQLRSQVAAAAGAWPLLPQDPANPEPGYPWLLEKEVAPAAPIGTLLAGFGGDVLYEPIAAVKGAQLSVMTSSGIARTQMILDATT